MIKTVIVKCGIGLLLVAGLSGCASPGGEGIDVTVPERGRLKPLSKEQQDHIQRVARTLEGERLALNEIWVKLGIYPVDEHLVDKACTRFADSLTCVFQFKGDYRIMITWDTNAKIQRLVGRKVKMSRHKAKDPLGDFDLKKLFK